jgi:hypothetical protein
VGRSTSRLVLAALVVAGVFLVPGAASAQTGDPACSLDAGEGNDMTLVCQTNGRAVQRLFVVFRNGTTLTSVTPITAGVTCDNIAGSPPHIICQAAPPVPAGSTLQVGLTSQDLYESNGEDSAAGCSPDCTAAEHNFGPSDLNGPDRSTPPPPAECTTWDWQVTIAPRTDAIDSAGIAQFDLDDLQTGSWTATVMNIGECRAPSTEMRVAADSRGRGLEIGASVSITPEEDGPSQILCIPFTGAMDRSLPCDVEALDPGQAHTAEVDVKVERRLKGRGTAFVNCDVTGEANRCENNEAEFRFRQFGSKAPGIDFAVPDPIGDQPARRLKRITGAVSDSASGASLSTAGKGRGRAKVHIALVRLPDALGEKCRWLRSRTGKFRSSDPSGGRCTQPVWLKAKGTRRWAYRLRKILPKGDYLLYARATDSKGRPQAGFDERSKEEFTLR